jgi:hypothetical protein
MPDCSWTTFCNGVSVAMRRSENWWARVSGKTKKVQARLTASWQEKGRKKMSCRRKRLASVFFCRWKGDEAHPDVVVGIREERGDGEDNHLEDDGEDPAREGRKGRRNGSVPRKTPQKMGELTLRTSPDPVLGILEATEGSQRQHREKRRRRPKKTLRASRPGRCEPGWSS